MTPSDGLLGGSRRPEGPCMALLIGCPRACIFYLVASSGDLGFFMGGIVGGTAARMTSVPRTIWGAGVIMLALAVLFQLRLQLQDSAAGAKLAAA